MEACKSYRVSIRCVCVRVCNGYYIHTHPLAHIRICGLCYIIPDYTMYYGCICAFNINL